MKDRETDASGGSWESVRAEALQLLDLPAALSRPAEAQMLDAFLTAETKIAGYLETHRLLGEETVDMEIELDGARRDRRMELIVFLMSAAPGASVVSALDSLDDAGRAHVATILGG